MDRATRLQRHLLDELTPGERREIEAELASDPTLRAELDRIRAEDAAFFVRFPASRLVPQIAARIDRASRRRRAAPPLLGALAAAAAVLVLLVARPGEIDRGGDGDREKSGEPHLWIFRQTGPRAEELHDGALVGQGDVVQLRFAPADRPYAVILSIDGAGAVTLHSPSGEAEPSAVSPRGAIDLPYAYRLDAAPGFERFVLLTSRHPLRPAEVMAAARAVAADRRADVPLPLDSDVEQTSVVLRKADR